MNDLDLEDIESRLYSEVYHGIIDETEPNFISNPTPTNLSKPINDMRSGGRYFGPWSPGAKFQSKNGPSKSNHWRPSFNRDPNRSGGFYSKNSGRPQKPDIPINQVVVVSPPKAIPVVYMSGKQAKKAHWKAKMIERKKQKRNQRVQRQILDLPAETVITLSDSDEDSCVVVEKLAMNSENVKPKHLEDAKKSDITLKNEEVILNESLSDDVIFVEPAPIEVINLDEEIVIQENAPNVESESQKKIQEVHQERKELLSTPDSASNDFMNNSGLDINGKNFNFNFSLHGSDFNSGEFLKPANRNETCETESSSSTTDVNSVNLMKTVVFNEVDFPKDDIFSEKNLESFGNFITPLRNNVAVVQSSPIAVPEAQNQSKTVIDSSDSSSESELEESQVQKVKNLPELSPMQRHKESSPQVVKKSKKSSLGSKFDLLNSGSPTSKEVKQKNLKKKKKNKKRKNDDNNVEESDKCEENEVDLKQKKRRSSQLEGPVLESQGKKKTVDPKNVENETDFVDNKKIEDTNEVTNTTLKDGKTADTIILDNTANDKKSASLEQGPNLTLDGFLVVDEVNQEASIILSSDSESVLSALHEQQDIQINCEDLEKDILEADSDKFSVKNLQQGMSNDPNLWKILDSDKSPCRINKGRRCNRCRQFGHMAIRCPNKVEVKCALCGASGHYEPRCPNKICTQCGQKSSYSTTYCNSCFKYRNYVCQLCFVVGHNSKYCPDLWRRYHLTTTEGPLTKYEGPVLKEKDQLWCSGCAQSGHLEHSCRFYKSIYPPADPFIKSYDDIYEIQVVDNSSRMNEQGSLVQNYHRAGYYPQNNINFGEFNYNQNNYGQVDQMMNPFMDGIFVANQQNFFPAVAPNVYQVPQPYPLNQIVFENPLPGFISFDAQDTSGNNCNQVPANDQYFGAERYFDIQSKPQGKRRNNNCMFFSSSGLQLQHFLTEELHRLSKLSLMSNKVVKEFRKRPIPRRSKDAKEEYYETLNMLLFGVYHLVDGKGHLERLKKFKREQIKYKVGSVARKRLHASYCYIFGSDKHYGVDYDDLLRRI